jgi:hypothetical protein
MRIVVRFIAVACALSLSAAASVQAGVWPKEADCPMTLPDRPTLKFIGAALDQHTDGPPWQLDSDLETKRPDGSIHIVTHHASYEILREAILIRVYSEIRNDSQRHLEQSAEIRIPIPGILMRCEGILYEKPGSEPDDWKRRRCVHDPDK